MREHANEVLEKINNEKDKEKQKNLLRECGDKLPYNMLLSLNFCDRIKLDLPEGVPPYKQDGDTDKDLFHSSLAKEIRKLANCMSGVQIPGWKKENIFMQVCECVPLKEAEVLVFAKDKALTELYPNITKELVHELFPNLVN